MSASWDCGSAAETGLTKFPKKFPSYSKVEVIGQLHNIIRDSDILRGTAES
jgi:hypothetical protein